MYFDWKVQFSLPSEVASSEVHLFSCVCSLCVLHVLCCHVFVLCVLFVLCDWFRVTDYNELVQSVLKWIHADIVRNQVPGIVAHISLLHQFRQLCKLCLLVSVCMRRCNVNDAVPGEDSS